jgi:hypothetical protein
MQTSAISPQADHSAGSEHPPVPEQPGAVRPGTARRWAVVSLVGTLFACHVTALPMFGAVSGLPTVAPWQWLLAITSGWVGGLRRSAGR